MHAAAIGNTSSLSENLWLAFEPGTDFEPVPPLGPHDWLAVRSWVKNFSWAQPPSPSLAPQLPVCSGWRQFEPEVIR